MGLNKFLLIFAVILFFAVMLLFNMKAFADGEKSTITAVFSVRATIVKAAEIDEDSINSKDYLEKYNISNTIKSGYIIYTLNCE